jgi:ArsR family transcriptional regulator
MGATKSEIFTENQNKIASLLKALAHPARIAIIQHLVQAEHCVCGDIVEQMGLAQATISQHLKELKRIGIVKGCVDGASVSYCIDEKVWREVGKEMEVFFRK